MTFPGRDCWHSACLQLPAGVPPCSGSLEQVFVIQKDKNTLALKGDCSRSALSPWHTVLMPRIIDLKMPLEYFEKDRANELEARIARFVLRKGDTLRFHEWDKKHRCYTGRYYDRKVTAFHKIHKATRFWKKTDLARYGLYIFTMERKGGRIRLVRRGMRRRPVKVV